MLTPLRQRDPVATRRRLIEAAKLVFSRHDYEAAGLRQISSQAGVNTTLVARYFGSKRDLFLTVVKEVLTSSVLLAGERATLGARLAQRIIDSDSREGCVDPLQLLLRSANQPAVNEALREAVAGELAAPLASWLGGERASERADAIVSLLLGGMLLRLLLPDRFQDAAARDASVAIFSQMIQALVE